jgi:hypothetical protein
MNTKNTKRNIIVYLLKWPNKHNNIILASTKTD